MELYIIAGPNGAGKTTFAHEFLPKYADCTNFVNADLIARGIAPFSPDTAAFRAGRMMLDEMHAFAKKRVPFAFETTLSGRGYLSFIRRCKAEGYEVHLFFLSLTSADLAVSRIKERVLRGGHDVPEQIVRRRFDRSSETSGCTIATSRIFGLCSIIRARVPRRLRLRKATTAV
jgi:predicted ABC-type ATPase